MQRRLVFVTRYRGFLIVLIVLIHTGITYGAAGSWYFTDNHDVLWVKLAGTFIGALSQSFALGAFFFLSAYFLPGSLESRGVGAYLRERAIKLLIPLVIYCFVVNPLLVMAVASWGHGKSVGLGPWFGTGPLWFVEALFIFTLAAIAAMKLSPPLPHILRRTGIPGTGAIILYILAAAALGFVVRIFCPIGWAVSNLQLGFFPMYVILFGVGLKAGRERWLEDAASVQIGLWSFLACLGLVAFPFVLFLGGASGDARPFLGGLAWQSAAYALWEAMTGTSVFIVTLVLFARARWMVPGAGESFSGSSYGIFLFHGPIIILIALAMRGAAVHPALKWLALSLCGVGLPWALTAGLRRVPGSSRVL